MSRGEFFARVGLLREIDPLTEAAYRFLAQKEAGQSDKGHAAAHNWHVSFHGSQFPGDYEKACGRHALYVMMDLPKSEGFFGGRKLTQVADAGKDIENRVVAAWHNAGYLLTPPPWDLQKEYEDADHWLTSTVDSIVVPPRRDRAIVCEIKTKYARDIASMKNLTRGPDEKHVNQIKCQIGLAHEAGPQERLRCFNSGRLAVTIQNLAGTEKMTLCPQHMHADCLEREVILPPTYGFIYYISRDNPVDTFEYYVEYDPAFMKRGRERLQEWRQYFIDDVLPQTNFSDARYPHPFGWKWGELPCKWCPFGDVCRTDNRAAIANGERIALSASAGVDLALGTRKDYSYEEAREAVFQRWGLDNNGDKNKKKDREPVAA